jgi:hypothetical protein
MIAGRRLQMFNLYRIEPNDGDGIKNAVMFTLVKPDGDGEGKPITDTETQIPLVGWVLLAENLHFWYHTSTITEIVSEEHHADHTEIIFKTLNSTYRLEKY